MAYSFKAKEFIVFGLCFYSKTYILLDRQDE